MKNPKNVIFPLSFSKILCIIDVAWGGENLLENIWSFRVFSSNMPIDPQEMGSCCKFDCCGDLGHPNGVCQHVGVHHVALLAGHVGVPVGGRPRCLVVTVTCQLLVTSSG